MVVCRLFAGVFLSVPLCILLTLGCVRTTPEAPVVWELTPSAQVTYAALLLDQSIRASDANGVLEASDILARLAPSPQAFSEAAAWLLLNKHEEQARELLLRAVELLPDDLGLRLLLAEIQLIEGEGDKAVATLTEFQKGRPDSPRVRAELAVVLLKAGRFAEAEREFDRLPQEVHTPYMRWCRARALTALDRPNQAAAELRRALRDDPEFVEAWAELGRVHESLGRYAEAEAAYEKLLDLNPADQDVWLHLIRLELRAGRTDEALDLARNGPGQYGFILAAATLFLDAGAHDAASVLLESVRTEPDVPEEVFFYLAAAAYEKKPSDPAAALEALQRISAQNRFYDRALRFRIQICFETGNHAAALQTADTAAEAFPTNKDFRLMQTQLLMHMQQWDKALAVLDKADGLWPEDVDLRFTRGTVLDAQGLKDQALCVMEAVAAADPDHHRALNYIGYTLAVEGRDLERALELLHRAHALSPESAYIMDSLAWAQYRSGDVAAAWITIRKTVRLAESDEAEIWDHYGDIALAAGNRKEARRGWNKALTLNPEDPAALRRKLNTL